MMKRFKLICVFIILIVLSVGECCAEQHMYIGTTDVIKVRQLYSGELSDVDYYEVEEGHPLYASVDGILYSKDRKCLISYPAARKQSRYQVEQDTECIGDYAFAYSSLEYIDLFSGECSTITEIGDGAFLGCHALKQLCIPETVLVIGESAFLYTSEYLLVIIEQSSVIRKTIPESVRILTLDNLYDYHEWMNHNDEIWTYCDLVGNERFQIENECLFRDGCLLAYPGLKRNTVFAVPEGTKRIDARILQNDYLEELIVPSSCEWIQNVQQEEGAFSKFVVDPSNPIYSARDGVLFNKDCTVLISYPRKRPGSVYIIPDTVYCIGDESFEYSTYVDEIVVPSSLEIIGSFAFYASSLQRINLPDSVILMEIDAFEYCPKLKEVIVSAGSYVESILKANMEDIDLSNSIVYED